jgi:hypothetical protein
MGNQQLLLKDQHFSVRERIGVVGGAPLWDNGDRMKRLFNWFIPHKGNAHTPRIFTLAGASVILIGILFLGGGVLFQQKLSTENSYLAAVLPSVLVDLANEDRTNESLTQLTENPLLVEAAQKKAADMAAKGYFAHVSPEGIEPWFWLQSVGYSYKAAGENLAVHFEDSEAVNKAWMASPSHRANIVNPEFTEIGIGTAVGMFEGRETLFVAEFFGKPAGASLVSTETVSIPPRTFFETETVGGPGTSAVEGARTENEISPIQGELDESIRTEDVPATQVLNAVEPSNKKSPTPSRISIPRQLVDDPLRAFATTVTILAAIISISLALTAHHHLPRQRLLHVGTGVFVLLVVIGSYFLVREATSTNGRTTEAAALIILTDGQ